MKSIDARNQIKIIGNDIDIVKIKYIADKLTSLNFEMPNGKESEFARLKKDVCPKFMSKVFELDFAYYVFWKHGESYPFQKWDVQETPEKSFELFTQISNAFYDKMTIALHEENEKRGRQYKKLYDRNMLIDKGKDKSSIDELKSKKLLDVQVD